MEHVKRMRRKLVSKVVTSVELLLGEFKNESRKIHFRDLTTEAISGNLRNTSASEWSYIRVVNVVRLTKNGKEIGGGLGRQLQLPSLETITRQSRL